MRVLIVEDEIRLAKRLQQLLLQIEPDAVAAGMTQGVRETVEWLTSNPAPDLILMDIELVDGQSFDIFQHTEVNAPVIFTTAYDEYAIRAFRVNSIDYLLKPIKEAELKQALGKYRASARVAFLQDNIDLVMSAMKLIEQQQQYRSRFLVRQGQRMLSIDISEIAYFYSEKGMSFFRTHANKKYIIEYPLDELEKSLPPQHFFRANRGYILSLPSVVEMHTWVNQKLKVEIRPYPGETVVISRDKAPAFRAWMGE